MSVHRVGGISQGRRGGERGSLPLPPSSKCSPGSAQPADGTGAAGSGRRESSMGWAAGRAAAPTQSLGAGNALKPESLQQILKEARQLERELDLLESAGAARRKSGDSGHGQRAECSEGEADRNPDTRITGSSPDTSISLAGQLRSNSIAQARARVVQPVAASVAVPDRVMVIDASGVLTGTCDSVVWRRRSLLTVVIGEASTTRCRVWLPTEAEGLGFRV